MASCLIVNQKLIKCSFIWKILRNKSDYIFVNNVLTIAINDDNVLRNKIVKMMPISQAPLNQTSPCSLIKDLNQLKWDKFIQFKWCHKPNYVNQCLDWWDTDIFYLYYQRTWLNMVITITTITISLIMIVIIIIMIKRVLCIFICVKPWNPWCILQTRHILMVIIFAHD